MRNLAMRLVENVVSLGGSVRYNSKVLRIELDKGGVVGIVDESGKRIKTHVVVSNASLVQTFGALAGREIAINKNKGTDQLIDKAATLKRSPSMFIVYLGIRKAEDHFARMGRTVWYLPTYETDPALTDIYEGRVDFDVRTMIAVFPGRFDPSLAPLGFECVNLEVLAPFVNGRFWRSKKDVLANRLIEHAETIIPKLRSRIVFKEVATPATIHRYTLNDEGAVYGLASTLSQMSSRVMPQRTNIPGLYLASHWTTTGTGQGGTTASAFAGWRASRLVLEDWGLIRRHRIVRAIIEKSCTVAQK
jgi:prolycopene isomerase